MTSYAGVDSIPVVAMLPSLPPPPPPPPPPPLPNNEYHESYFASPTFQYSALAPTVDLYSQGSGWLGISPNCLPTPDNRGCSYENYWTIPQHQNYFGGNFNESPFIASSNQNDWYAAYSAEKNQLASSSNDAYVCKLCEKRFFNDINFSTHTSGIKHCRVCSFMVQTLKKLLQKFLVMQWALGFDAFDRLFGDISFTRTLPGQPSPPNVEDRYALRAYRSGIVNKFNCKACGMKMHEMSEWYEHVYSWKHGQNMLSLQATTQSEAFSKKFADLPGANPILFPVTAGSGTSFGAQSGEQTEQTSADAVITEINISSPQDGRELSDAQGNRLTTSSLASTHQPPNTVFPVQQTTSPATLADGRSTNISSVTSSSHPEMQSTLDDCSAIQSLNDKTRNGSTTWSSATGDDCIPKTASLVDSDVSGRGHHSARQSSPMKIHKKKRRKHRQARRALLDFGSYFTGKSRKLSKRNDESCELSLSQPKGNEIIGSQPAEASDADGDVAEGSVEPEMTFAPSDTDSSSGCSYVDVVQRRKRRNTSSGLRRRRRRSGSSRRDDDVIVRKFRRIISITDDEEKQAVLRETLFDFVQFVVGKQSKVQSSSGVDDVVFAAMSPSEQSAASCIRAVTGEQSLLRCNATAQLLRSIDDQLMFSLSWFLACDQSLQPFSSRQPVKSSS